MRSLYPGLGAIRLGAVQDPNVPQAPPAGASQQPASQPPGFAWGTVLNETAWGALLGLVLPGVSVRSGAVLGAAFGLRKAVFPISGGPRFDDLARRAQQARKEAS